MMKRTTSADVRAFRSLSENYLAGSYERFPEQASRLGLSEFDSRLGRNDLTVRTKHQAETVRCLEAVEALPASAFAGDDWLDRRAFLSMLRMDVLFSNDLPRWRDNPQVHCDAAVDSLFDLVVRHIGRLDVMAPALEARLAALPDYLQAGEECVRRPVPLWTELAGKACEGAVTFLDELETELLRVSKSPKNIPSLINGARRAFENYADAIARKKPGSPNGFCVGRPVFEYLMRERLGFEMSLPEARAEGLRLIEQLTREVASEAKKLGFSSAREALEQAAAEWLPDRPLLEIYESTTHRLKSAVRKMDLATLPKGESLRVLPAPPFLRHQFPTAAYSAPPPFSKQQTGIFWVNDLSLGKTKSSERQAEIRQHFGLELTSVHEAYPGHHLQFSVQNRHRSKIRRLFAHSIFYEGWTMWCEKLAVDLGLVAHPAARLIQLHDALWRAYRIVIDCGLHSGELTHASAARLLTKGVGFTMARAKGDVNWYTSSPTVPMSYLLGRIEVEKLHTRLVTKKGWSLRQFNDWMLSHGALPYSWIVSAMET
jgi:uncharacterized protein (DUF885 family)